MSNQVSLFQQVIRYTLHLLAVYIIVYSTSMWLAGFIHGTLLPLIEQHRPEISAFQFAYSHLLVLSFVPAMLVGYLYSQWYRQEVALFVWMVPLGILVYKFFAFPTTVFQSHFSAAFHQYFSGGFSIPEFGSYKDLFELLATNSDMQRGWQQQEFTAPVYASFGYSTGSWLAMRFRIAKLDCALENIRPGWPRPGS